MNTINMEEHNQIDDLRIERAISGLMPQEVEQLKRLLAAHEEEAENAESFGEFEECVALVDLWLGEKSPMKLDSDQRHRLIQRFAGGSPDRGLKRTPPHGHWFWLFALSAAAACLVLGSLVWINRLTDPSDTVMFSASELRKQMLADPPDDMLRWKWVSFGDSSVLSNDSGDEFLGDIIWSDYQQQGYAFLNIANRTDDPSVYQLLLYEELPTEEQTLGILGCEFRFDGYSSPFVVIIRPETKVSPQRFAVHRALDEPNVHAGPTEPEEIHLIAEANPLHEIPDAAITSDAADETAIISGPDEQTTTF